jgi:carbamoyltransferase
MTAAIVGLGGARRNSGAALCRGGVLVAACERERITRTRGQGMLADGFPEEAVNEVAGAAGVRVECGGDLTYASAEDHVTVPDGFAHLRYPHHYAHAASSFLSSPFTDARVVVCDRHGSPDVSLWKASPRAIEPVSDTWEGPGFAGLYGVIARAFGLTPDRDEHRLEALARLSAGGAPGSSFEIAALDGSALRIADDLAGRLQADVQSAAGDGSLADLASGVQRQVADLLVDWLAARIEPGSNLCLAGGLFYNTNFNTRIAEQPAFRAVFVPTHPGNTGLAVGCALAAAAERPDDLKERPTSPFLGPSYGAEEIKATLDNCKLSYEYANDRQLVEWTVDTLRAGHLVGWFHGPMEWGPRALGHRSILASPLSPYVLENLNRFLKRREVVRSYGVSVREEDAARLFVGAGSSPFMQFEYRVRDPELFRHVVPPGSERLRVHTVGGEPRLLGALLDAFGGATGLPVLVNTSFNGFHEPIVCTPRDAVRVFYGTGLDMLVMGNFILRK